MKLIKYNYISVPSSTLQLVNKCVLCLHVGMVTLLNMYPGNTSSELHYVICMYIRCIFKLCFWLACSESWQDSDNPATNEIHLINWSLANVTTRRHSGTLLVCSIQLCSILFTEGGHPRKFTPLQRSEKWQIETRAIWQMHKLEKDWANIHQQWCEQLIKS